MALAGAPATDVVRAAGYHPNALEERGSNPEVVGLSKFSISLRGGRDIARILVMPKEFQMFDDLCGLKSALRKTPSKPQDYSSILRKCSIHVVLSIDIKGAVKSATTASHGTRRPTVDRPSASQ